MYLDKVQNSTLTFKSGLSREFARQASECKAQDVSAYLLKQGVQSDFKGNNILAFCCLKGLEIMQKASAKAGIKFAPPKGIIFEDFSKLKGIPDNYWGFCNLLPTKLYKNSDEKISERVVFFDKQNYNEDGERLLDYMDAVAESDYATKNESSSNFLIKIIHEYAHSAHEKNMQTKFSGKALFRLINDTLKPESVDNFQQKHAQLVSNEICSKAVLSPFEAIAYDLSRRIINHSESSFEPYKKVHFWQKAASAKDGEDNLETLMKKFWNGELDS